MAIRRTTEITRRKRKTLSNVAVELVETMKLFHLYHTSRNVNQMLRAKTSTGSRKASLKNLLSYPRCMKIYNINPDFTEAMSSATSILIAPVSIFVTAMVTAVRMTRAIQAIMYVLKPGAVCPVFLCSKQTSLSYQIKKRKQIDPDHIH